VIVVTPVAVVLISIALISLLWWFQEPPTVEYWVTQLETGNVWRKERARRELVALAPQSIGPVAELLKRGGGDLEAWRCLRDIGDAAVSELAGLVSERYEANVRIRAMSALVEALCDNPKPSIINPENVSRAVQAIVSCLHDQNPAIRRAAASDLAELGRRALPAAAAVKSAMDDTDDWVRVFAATFMGDLDPADERFQTTVEELLRSKDEEIRAETLRILIRIGSKGAFAFQSVMEIAGHERSSIDMRERAISSLGAFGPVARPAVPFLRSLRHHEEARLRDASVKALQKLGAQ
jgi:HEAT repeat protein